MRAKDVSKGIRSRDFTNSVRPKNPTQGKRIKDPTQINRQKEFEKDIMSRYPFFVSSDYPHQDKKVPSSDRRRKGLQETKSIAKNRLAKAKALEDTRLKNEKKRK